MCSQIKIDLKAVITSINDYFFEEAQMISNNIHNNKKYKSDLFKRKVVKNICATTSIKSSQKGLYVFQIISKNHLPVNGFDLTKYAPKLNAKNHSINADFQNKQILYLGKSEEKLGKRLDEHIKNPSCSTTYALRLNDNNRQFLYNNLKLFYYELNSEYNDYAKTILSSIESYLHDLLSPRVGTKRT